MADTVQPPSSAPRPPASRLGRPADERVNKVTSIPFIAVHLLPFLAIWTGVTVEAVVLGVVLFWTRMFFITAGYHRYFAHRSYKLARVPQFLMAFGGTTAAQKGPLWWAAHHRDHHRFSDTERDIHSPLKGFWWSHVGWILCDKFAHTDEDRIKDFAAFPELRWLNRWDMVGPWVLGIVSFLIAGWPGLLIGFFASTVVLWHSTFLVNSLAHVMGRRRYATEDTSRNSAIIAVLTMGEGWHNNHHYYPASARQGFFWWEWDPSFYVLKALSFVGIVKGLKTPPAKVRDANRIRRGAFDIGMFKAYWSKAADRVHAAGAGLDKVADATAARRQELDGKVKELLDEKVAATLASAEELARQTRRTRRDLGVDVG